MIFGAFTGVIFGSANFEEKQNVLDINAYLEASDGEHIYPTLEQIEMLKSVIPRASFQPAPPISNRDYWETLVLRHTSTVHFFLAIRRGVRGILYLEFRMRCSQMESYFMEQ